MIDISFLIYLPAKVTVMQGICNFQQPIQNLDELHLAGHGNKTKQYLSCLLNITNHPSLVTLSKCLEQALEGGSNLFPCCDIVHNEVKHT